MIRIVDTPLAGCKLVETTPFRDDRGYFARVFDADAFRAHGLEAKLAQASVSFNKVAGTLRGLHYQAAPRMETKLVRCIRGAVFDVAVDIRPGSATFGRWYGVELTEENLRQLYIPVGFAHGFQTLADDSIVAYHIDVAYDPALSAGLRYDDPTVGVTWPRPPVRLSERDLRLPLLGDLDPRTVTNLPARSS